MFVQHDQDFNAELIAIPLLNCMVRDDEVGAKSTLSSNYHWTLALIS